MLLVKWEWKVGHSEVVGKREAPAGGREGRWLTWAALRKGSLSRAPAQPFCSASKKAARGPNSSELDFCRL